MRVDSLIINSRATTTLIPSALLFFHTLTFVLLFGAPQTAQAQYIWCSATEYAQPSFDDCYHALTALPDADHSSRFFLEPQMRTRGWRHDWPEWVDPRPIQEQQTTIQTPKFWSSGSCNIGLLSYVHESVAFPLAFSAWSDIFTTALQLAHDCLVQNHQGGAATVPSSVGTPVISVFLWASGAPFEEILASYMSAQLPSGIDPSFPRQLQIINGTMVNVGNPFNGTTLTAVS